MQTFNKWSAICLGLLALTCAITALVTKRFEWFAPAVGLTVVAALAWDEYKYPRP
jgi:hypothetical protein